jgi:selenocysteine-specific translation elongation factor
VLAVLTKADQVARQERRVRRRQITTALGLEEDACVLTSASSGEGMEELRDSVLAFLD